MADPAILSGSLETPLAEATFIRAGWKASRAAAILAAGDFDQAPVRSGTRLIGYALRLDLEANPTRLVRGATRALDEEIVLSSSAHLGALLATLRDRRFAFMVGDSGISGFVTPSDLNKQAARAHFYLLIAGLEIRIADLLRHQGPEPEQLLGFLLPVSQRLIQKRFRADAEAGIEVDYLVYMLFSQLLNIVGREPVLFQSLGYESRSAWRRATRGLIRLRNDVMHPTRQFFGASRSVADLIEAETQIRDLLDRFDSLRLEGERVPRIASLPPLVAPSSSVGLTLHSAMARALKAAGHPMRPRELAKVINATRSYQRGDGAAVPASQISARANNYQHLFTRTPKGLGLRDREWTDA